MAKRRKLSGKKPRRPKRATPTVIAGETFYLVPVLTADRSRVIELPWRVVNAMAVWGCLLQKRKDRPLFQGQKYLAMTKSLHTMPRPVKCHPELLRWTKALARAGGASFDVIGEEDGAGRPSRFGG